MRSALTAYHEAGHAIVGRAMPKANPVHKVTIVPRGRAGGYTLFLPEEDQHYRTVIAVRGRHGRRRWAAVPPRRLILGDFTTGAGERYPAHHRIARAMVTRYGMSDRLGPIQLGDVQEMIFLGREI